MQKLLGIILVALALVGFAVNPQANKAAQAQTGQNPPAPATPAGGMQHGDSPRPEAESDKHVKNDVWLVSSPAKDGWDKTSAVVSIILGLVGIAGIVVGICTLRFLRKQTTEMRHQRILMRRTLNIIRRQADLMEAQANSMGAQLTEMQKVSEIENKTLVLQYRPRVIARNAKATGLGSEPDNPGVCRLELLLVNTGGSPAYILGASFRLLSYIASDINNIQFIDGPELRIEDGVLQPGERCPIKEESLETGTINDSEWMLFYSGRGSGRGVILMGTIWYKDDIGIPRETGLHRVLDVKTGRFEPKKENEEEYSD